jgi:enamine deaminase RidA (YjgF/YER057c/UK114 family)
MQIRKLNSSKVTQPAGGYAQLLEVAGAQRFAFVSGQIPQSLDGKVPSGFDEQCRQVWSNIEAQLAAADMTLANLVKVTTFLSDRKYNLANRAIRNEILGEHAPALTVIIADIFDSEWLLEIEAIAAA